MSHTIISNKCPIITNEENAGFLQAKNGIRYSATVPIEDRRISNSYFILYNPLHSMKDIYISRITHTNTADEPVLVRCYCNCCDLLPKSAERSNRITNNNTRYCDVPPTAQLYFGTNIPCINNTPLLEYAVKSYENFVNELNGGIILSPGSYYFEITRCFSPDNDREQISSISWWEQPIRTCCSLCFERNE